MSTETAHALEKHLKEMNEVQDEHSARYQLTDNNKALTRGNTLCVVNKWMV